MTSLLNQILAAHLASWRPFVTPAPLWDYWWLLLFPLLAAVAIIYKCTKVSTARRIPAEAGQLWFSAVVAMTLGALALYGIVYLVLG